jgi:hypothetical protein
VNPDDVRDRVLADLFARYPHLKKEPSAEILDDAQWKKPATGLWSLTNLACAFGGIFWFAWTVRHVWVALFVPTFGAPWPYGVILLCLVLYECRRSPKWDNKRTTRMDVFVSVIMTVLRNVLPLGYVWAVTR